MEGETLEKLLKQYLAERRNKPERPRTTTSTTRVFDRDALVVAIGRKRANFRCEVPECPHPLFTTTDGRPYTEVHHIVPLAEGGRDVIENVACLCPSHHREIHLGVAAKALQLQLQTIRAVERPSTDRAA
jgi:predicted HNH restriction endonuclease